MISIHALREEGDDSTASGATKYTDISIHALREEGDPVMVAVSSCAVLFLSTPSARRATALGGRLLHIGKISIHALREEGDVCPSGARPSAA